MNDLRLYNNINRKKENFVPLNPDHVRVYTCGPTVYDRIHVGNARPIVVFDVLVRLLRFLFPKVTYVRNITDVDDKINRRAAELSVTIDELCLQTIQSFHEDTVKLGAIEPDIEPRATHHISEMQDMISTLIQLGHAYEVQGHVLFQVSTMPDYGKLSKRDMNDMIAGARVEVAPYKRAPADFVMWKPSKEGQPGWNSPWGWGRPGWHIECSAMAKKYLGETFDIHAGGLDLIFPHHENEIAQSCCAHKTKMMAKYWVHNGFVTMNDEKMSKSLGNIITVDEAVSRYRGETVRLALLMTQYRAPLDLSENTMYEAKASLDRLYRAVDDFPAEEPSIDQKFISYLLDDLNTPAAITRLHELASKANKGDVDARTALKSSGSIIGLLGKTGEEWAKSSRISEEVELDDDEIDDLILARADARNVRDYDKADRIRDRLAKSGVFLEDKSDRTIWRRN